MTKAIVMPFIELFKSTKESVMTAKKTADIFFDGSEACSTERNTWLIL